MRRGIRPRRYSFPLLAGAGVAAEGRRGRPASNALLQFRQQPPQRLAAVAHEIFLLGIELGGGLAEVAQEKMRIVAEPVRAAGLGDDLARPDSLGDHRFGILRVAQENDDAVVVRAPAVLVGEQFDQLLVVARILGFTPGPRARRRLAGKPRRMHAGLSIERSRANTRVVCERRQPRAAARVARLGERVLDESAVRLFGIGYSEARLRNDLHAERREQRLELAELPGIGGGEHEFFHASILTCEASHSPPRMRRGNHESPSAAFCLAMSSAIPCIASASSASICAAEKGSPSAVPWTSTKPPEPVITTFMSVSQSESSA